MTTPPERGIEEIGAFPNDPTGLRREFAIKFHRGDFYDAKKDKEWDNSEMISDWWLEQLHQELQKARQDWLREEIVKLEGMKKSNIPVLAGGGSKPSEYHKAGQVHGANIALQTIIDRYQSELDQPTN